MKKQIPNILTLLNLLSGTIAVIFAVNNDLVTAAYFVFLGIFFDFFDGFAARLLNVQGELGKQLDSLADVVTSGVVPGIVMYKLLQTEKSLTVFNTEFHSWKTEELDILPFLGLLITLAAAYRLAKFNIDERQSSSFIGLPTPAAALVVLSLPLITAFGSYDFVISLIENKIFLIVITIILAIIMNAEIPLFSLKFKNFSFKNNKIQIAFLAITLLLCILLKFAAIPVVIIVYVLFSLIENKLVK
ncbi:CDP-alcohol phosphatidyltransferase family protein [Lutibacter citreus]|uniref:CDP-alcohol phosphatidyltransferase family protein n=1 Tax=Lutibacter citreus TaxID=2138210 RepID=UPI000DBE4821